MKKTISFILCLVMMAYAVSPAIGVPELPPAQAFAQFSDIENHEAKAAIEKWVGYGVTHGSYGGLFRPDDEINRAELAAILVHLIGYTSQSAQKPFDINENDWFYNDIMKLVAANVMRGSNGYVRPYASVSREEAVTIIARAFKISERLDGRINFVDSNNISTWAKGLVHNMQLAGYLTFFGDEFSPTKKITRSEVILILDAMFAAYYSQPGVYSGTIDGNVIIKSAGVFLVDANIQGDVYIVEGIGDRYYTIDENTVVIDGSIYARSGRRNPYPYIDPESPMVALTFDDGPTKTTAIILDTLEEYDARATFFVVGKYISTHKDTLIRAVSIGCELSSHTWAHTKITAMTKEELIRDTQRVSDALFDAVQIRPVLLRPPDGSYSTETNNTVGTMGLATVYWSLDPKDWSHRDAETTNQRVLDGVKDGSIILLHDLVESTGTAVRTLVPALMDAGYQLVTVSEMLEYSDIGIRPGAFYISKYRYR